VLSGTTQPSSLLDLGISIFSSLHANLGLQVVHARSLEFTEAIGLHFLLISLPVSMEKAHFPSNGTSQTQKLHMQLTFAHAQ